MTYTTGIPTTGQSLGNSRPKVQGNFDYINTAFAINHVAFNASGVGKHKFVDLVQQGSAPVPIAGTDTLYSKVTNGLGELFYVRGGGGTPIQLTDSDPVNANPGFTSLTGGMIMQFGSSTLSGTTKNIVFPTPFTLAGVNTPPYSIQVCLRTSLTVTVSIWVSAFAFDNFDIQSNPAANGRDFFWVAIGPKT